MQLHYLQTERRKVIATFYILYEVLAADQDMVAVSVLCSFTLLLTVSQRGFMT